MCGYPVNHVLLNESSEACNVLGVLHASCGTSLSCHCALEVILIGQSLVGRFTTVLCLVLILVLRCPKPFKT